MRNDEIDAIFNGEREKWGAQFAPAIFDDCEMCDGTGAVESGMGWAACDRCRVRANIDRTLDPLRGAFQRVIDELEAIAAGPDAGGVDAKYIKWVRGQLDDIDADTATVLVEGI